MIAPPPIQASWKTDSSGRLVSSIWINWLNSITNLFSTTSQGSISSEFQKHIDITNGNPHGTDHVMLDQVIQSDDTDESSIGGKHVTNAQVKKYEDHRNTINSNPHGTSWDQLTQTASFLPFTAITGSEVPTHSEGLVFYDAEDHSLGYYNERQEVRVNIGREMLVRVYNNTGFDLVDGQVVYVNGANASWPTVKLAKADTEIDSQSTLGMVTCPIPNNEYGYVCTSGVVHDLNTSAHTAGTILYLSSTLAGDLTDTMPLQPNYVVEIGTVLYSDTTKGRIFVHVDRKPWDPNIEIQDTSASIVLPTTPTVFIPSTTIKSDGFTYDNTTGIVTVNVSSSYAISILFNAEPSSANKNIYFYVEEDSGSGFSIVRYSARYLQLLNAQETQVTIAAAKYYPVGTKLRYNIWADATVTLKTTNLPGTTPGTVTVPAYRFLMA